MSDTILLVILIIPLVLSLALGIWIGLGYPGLYGKYEKTGKAPRKTPFEMMVDWIMKRLDR